MSLLVWNDASDSYNHTQQAENWAKVDQHDHTDGKGVLIGTNAIADAAITVDKLASGVFADTVIGDSDIATNMLADSSVTTAKIAGANVTDAKLASPNSGAYRNVLSVASGLANTTPSTVRVFTISGGLVPDNFSSIGPSGGPAAIWVDPADYTVASKTSKFRLRAQVVTGVSTPTAVFTFSLYEVSPGAGNWQIDSAAGSTIAITGSSTNTVHQDKTADFNIPSAGYYAIGISTNVTMTAPVSLNAQLQQRWA